MKPKHGRKIAYLSLGLSLGACAINKGASPLTSTSLELLLEKAYWCGKVQFDYNDFYATTSPNSAGCAGDARNFFDPISGNALPASTALYPGGTLRPSFIKNVSLDITNANDTGASNLSFSCSYGSGADTPASNICATLDYVSAGPPGYNTGYYTTYDSHCSGAGPITSGDPTLTKLLAGGVYFDIDRSQLGARENLLLNLTFLPLGQANNDPSGAGLTATDEAIFRIHLIKTGQEFSELERTLQPRFLSYTGSSSYPEVVASLFVLSPPTGQPRTEQVMIPLAMNSDIDRIRIERYSGTGILVDASLYRMGTQ